VKLQSVLLLNLKKKKKWI